MNTAFMPACVHGDMIIRVSTMDGASTPEMKMATACVKSMSIPWKGFGRSCGAGCALIGAFHKKNFRSTSGSSSLCTMPENEAKRCFMGSLNYWSHKTLESNMSLSPMALYRLVCALGHQNLVAMLTRCGLPLPVYFLADEKQSHCLTDKVSLPTIVRGRVLWHVG